MKLRESLDWPYNNQKNQKNKQTNKNKQTKHFFYPKGVTGVSVKLKYFNNLHRYVNQLQTPMHFRF